MSKRFETLREAKKHLNSISQREREIHDIRIYNMKKSHPRMKKRYLVGSYLEWLNY